MIIPFLLGAVRKLKFFLYLDTLIPISYNLYDN